MSKLTNVSPFKFWCQKVLPLVYDESLSYYETLCKVVAHLNKIVEATNNQNDFINELYQKFVELKDYVENYLNSVDFDAIVQEKLNGMVVDGTLATIINESLFGQLNADISSIRNDVDSLNDSTNSLLQDVSNLNGAVEQLDAGVDNLSAVVTANKSATDASIEALSDEVRDIQDEIVGSLPNIKDVKNFGAKGDGVTDDTQAFIDALIGGGLVFVPKGEYRITRPLYLESNTTLFGDGVLIDEAEQPADFEVSFGLINAISCVNCTISNIGIRGTYIADKIQNKVGILIQHSEGVTVSSIRANTTSYSSAVIEFFTSKNCTCSNCVIKDFGQTGIGCFDHCENIVIKGNIVENTLNYNGANMYGIVVSSMRGTGSFGTPEYCNKNIICDSNYVKVNKWEAIDAHGGDTLIVTNNIGISPYQACVMFSYDDRNMVIKNCKISNNYFETTVQGDECCTIDGEYSSFCNNYVKSLSIGVRIRHSNKSTGFRNGIIDSNVIYSNVRCLFQGIRCQGVVISNNLLIGDGNCEGWNTSDYNTPLINPSVNFRNNTIRNCSVDIVGPANNNISFPNSSGYVRLENNDYDPKKVTNWHNMFVDMIDKSQISQPPRMGRLGDICRILGATNGEPILLYCTTANAENRTDNYNAVFTPFGANGW